MSAVFGNRITPAGDRWQAGAKGLFARNRKFYMPGLQDWGGTGTPIGDYTTLANAFDSNTDKLAAACAGSAGAALTNYIGKDWGVGQSRVIGMLRCYASSNTPWGSAVSVYGFTPRGSNDGVSWTNIGPRVTSLPLSRAYIDVPCTSLTAYRYHSVLVDTSPASFMNMAQVRTYSANYIGDAIGVGAFAFTVPERVYAVWAFLHQPGGSGGSAPAGNSAAGGPSGGASENVFNVTPGEVLTFSLPLGGMSLQIGATSTPPAVATLTSNLQGVLLTGTACEGTPSNGDACAAGSGLGGNPPGYFGTCGNPGLVGSTAFRGGSGARGFLGGGAEGGGEVAVGPGAGGAGTNNGLLTAGDGGPACGIIEY